jgi:tRNA (guanine37-N1)-methyltransferase
MKIDILTLFPEMCESFLSESIIGRARNKGILDIICHNIRDYTNDKHNRVDDAPYSGGPGMLMQAEPIYSCYNAVKRSDKPYFIYMSPKGKVLNQEKVKELAKKDNIMILCGHYEGVDQRILDKLADEEISIGDYVLTGGEMPALVLVDAISRMIDGVLSSEDAFSNESHYDSLLEYPQYTRPAVWQGMEVPPVLISGHDKNIKIWKRQKSIEETFNKRPDLLEKATLTKDDLKYLEELKKTKNSVSE